jgi:hypothetical protein
VPAWDAAAVRNQTTIHWLSGQLYQLPYPVSMMMMMMMMMMIWLEIKAHSFLGMTNLLAAN